MNHNMSFNNNNSHSNRMNEEISININSIDTNNMSTNDLAYENLVSPSPISPKLLASASSSSLIPIPMNLPPPSSSQTGPGPVVNPMLMPLINPPGKKINLKELN